MGQKLSTGIIPSLDNGIPKHEQNFMRDVVLVVIQSILSRFIVIHLFRCDPKLLNNSSKWGGSDSLDLTVFFACSCIRSTVDVLPAQAGPIQIGIMPPKQ